MTKQTYSVRKSNLGHVRKIGYKSPYNNPFDNVYLIRATFRMFIKDTFLIRHDVVFFPDFRSK